MRHIEKRLTRFDVVSLVVYFIEGQTYIGNQNMNASDKSRLTHYEWEREQRNSRGYI